MTEQEMKAEMYSYIERSGPQLQALARKEIDNGENEIITIVMYKENITVGVNTVKQAITVIEGVSSTLAGQGAAIIANLKKRYAQRSLGYVMLLFYDVNPTDKIIQVAMLDKTTKKKMM